jgi:hypothetical protein
MCTRVRDVRTGATMLSSAPPSTAGFSARINAMAPMDTKQPNNIAGSPKVRVSTRAAREAGPSFGDRPGPHLPFRRPRDPLVR